MDKFNARTFRLLIFTVAVCILFVVCLPFAYRNVPKNNIREYRPSYEMSTVADEGDIKSDTKNETYKQENSKKKEDKKAKISEEVKITNNLEPIEEFENAKTNMYKEQNLFDKAVTLRKNGNYESAVYEYEKIAKNTDDQKIQANCYEEIARTYASIKRYSSALSYAEKAFNLQSNSDREILLARIYYKTGNSEKATELINSVLKRDFDE